MGLLCLLHVLPIFSESEKIKGKIVFASGSPYGFYYRTAEDIIDYLNGTFQDTEIIHIMTNGSSENIELLRDGLADITILQRDVAIETYYHKLKPFKNFEIILPLFPEALQIFVNDKENIISFSEFIQYIHRKELNNLAIGSPRSVGNIMIRKILNMFGVSNTEHFYDERPFSESIPDFKSGKISALAVIAGFPLPQFSADIENEIGIVSIDESDINHIFSHLNNLDKISFPASIYPFVSKSDAVQSVGTWAFIVARTGALNKTLLTNEAVFIKVLLDQLSTSRGNTPFCRTYARGGVFECINEKDKSYIKPKFKNYSHFFRGLPLNDGLESYFIAPVWSKLWYGILIILGAVVVVLIFKFAPRIDFLKLWKRYKHFFYSFIFLILSFFLISRIIFYVEQRFYANFSVRGPILDLSLMDIYVWLFIFIVTGFNNNIFPLSLSGKILATSTTYVVWLAAIFSIVREFIFNYNKRKRRSGMKKVKHTNHIVICGWNESVPHFLKSSFSALISSFLSKRRKIVIISPKVKDLLLKDEQFKDLHDRQDLDFVDGEVRDVKSLELANIIAAKTVVLLADDRTFEADERTLLRALSISKYVKKILGMSLDHIYIIAEINHPEFKESLLEADVNEVICSPKIIESLVIQSMLNHGISHVIDCVLFYNEDNEFYIIEVGNHPSLVDKPFDELLIHLRTYGVLLIGIKIIFIDDLDEPIIDKDEIKRKLSSKGLKREIIINPTIRKEKEYRTSSNDNLIVFALDETTISKIN
jgi:TRAP transporter TAXI family solute receptor